MEELRRIEGQREQDRASELEKEGMQRRAAEVEVQRYK